MEIARFVGEEDDIEINVVPSQDVAKLVKKPRRRICLKANKLPKDLNNDEEEEEVEEEEEEEAEETPTVGSKRKHKAVVEQQPDPKSNRTPNAASSSSSEPKKKKRRKNKPPGALAAILAQMAARVPAKALMKPPSVPVKSTPTATAQVPSSSPKAPASAQPPPPRAPTPVARKAQTAPKHIATAPTKKPAQLFFDTPAAANPKTKSCPAPSSSTASVGTPAERLSIPSGAFLFCKVWGDRMRYPIPCPPSSAATKLEEFVNSMLALMEKECGVKLQKRMAVQLSPEDEPIVLTAPFFHQVKIELPNFLYIVYKL